MKALNTLIVATIALCFVSCQKETDRLTDEQDISGKKKFLVKVKFYEANGTVDSEYYVLYIVDSAARVIYTVVDTVADIYESRHFDINGRLEKIVYNNADTVLPSRDSMMITRPNVSTFSWSYSPGFGGVSTTATITVLAGGRKKIAIVEQGQAPGKVHEIFLNTAGAVDSTILDIPATATQYSENNRRKIMYDGSGKPVTVIRSLHQPTVDFTFTSTEQLVRDAHDNAYLLEFIDKMYGSDLAWAGDTYVHGISSGSVIPYLVGDRLGLLKGSVQSMAVNQESVSNGTVIESDNYLFEYLTQYDAGGRIILWNEKQDGQLLYSAEIEYFD